VREPVFSRPELAARAGVDLAFIVQLCELGILGAGREDRFSEGDVRRVAAAGELPGVRFEAIGPVELKGLTEAVILHVARRAA
jgi:hypothetical protein